MWCLDTLISIPFDPALYRSGHCSLGHRFLPIIVVVAFPQAVAGRLRHLSVELSAWRLRVSASTGQRTLTAGLDVPPAGRAATLTSHVSVALSRRHLNVSRDGGACDGCFASSPATAESGSEAKGMASGVMYLGGVPEVTPYVRSRLKATDGFRGCLGVRWGENWSL